MLTRRQREILGLRAKGLRRKEVAARLAVSEDTVKVHISAAYKRLGVDNLMDALHVIGLLIL